MTCSIQQHQNTFSSSFLEYYNQKAIFSKDFFPLLSFHINILLHCFVSSPEGKQVSKSVARGALTIPCNPFLATAHSHCHHSTSNTTTQLADTGEDAGNC